MSFREDRVLVTGGAGFIGRHLVRQLVEQERRWVRVLDLPGTSGANRWPDRVEWLEGDIRDPQMVQRAVRNCKEVYHLAANPQLWTWPRRRFHEVNYVGTVHVLRAAVEAGARVLHTSTESILTRSRQKEPIREDQIVPEADVIGPYCRSKWRAECYAFQLASKGGSVLVVNPTLPIGPGDYGRSPPTQMILDFCQGKRREYLDAELNLIDVRDVACGMIRAMEVGKPGRRYLLGHENLSIHEVFSELARLTGLPPPRWRVPYPVALLAAYVSEFLADQWTGQIPAATITGVRLTRRRMHFDASVSLAELGLKPRPIRESLAEALSWFGEVGWIDPVRSREREVV